MVGKFWETGIRFLLLTVHFTTLAPHLLAFVCKRQSSFWFSKTQRAAEFCSGVFQQDTRTCSWFFSAFQQDTDLTLSRSSSVFQQDTDQSKRFLDDFQQETQPPRQRFFSARQATVGSIFPAARLHSAIFLLFAWDLFSKTSSYVADVIIFFVGFPFFARRTSSAGICISGIFMVTLKGRRAAPLFWLPRRKRLHSFVVVVFHPRVKKQLCKTLDSSLPGLRMQSKVTVCFHAFRSWICLTQSWFVPRLFSGTRIKIMEESRRPLESPVRTCILSYPFCVSSIKPVVVSEGIAVWFHFKITNPYCWLFLSRPLRL